MQTAKLFIMKKTKNHGGLRPYGGRKPLADEEERKVGITIYVRRAAIKKHGGNEKYREKVYERIPDLL